MPSKVVWAASAAAAAAALAWYFSRPAAAPQAAPLQSGARAPQLFAQTTSASSGLPDIPQRAAQRRQLVEQLELVNKTYCDYAAGTRYPDTSRPVSQHPDQVYPNQPVTEANPMRGADGKADGAVMIQSSQSRVFMVAGEAVAFSLRAVDPQGAVLPLVVTRAVAAGMTYKGARPTTQLALPFADDGGGADAVAGDGAFAAVLAPAQSGLASFNGTIRTEVRYSVNGRPGVLLFDVIYSPEVPAIWTGSPRETVQDGSLVYVLPAEVRKAGRYIVSGRVDDAKGQPYALATFNELLPAGPAEIRLTVFGKLLHDSPPAMPLTLRDVDGYLLKENTDPDRAMMPRLEGRIVVGKPHALKSFSDAEWQSEQRQRHLDEFARDVGLARGALARFDPAAPQPASACVVPVK